MRLSIGIDIGSTTVKIAVMEGSRILFTHYERHMSQVRTKTLEILEKVKALVGDEEFTVSISGSAGLGLANSANVSFVQEVFATEKAVRLLLGDVDIVVELGGEDAKILFLTGGVEERMNGTCAGGTGSFIDQMAVLLNLSPDEMDKQGLAAERLYPIASRCGVFAKSDIQPLLNQNADKRDISASIFHAVVEQTITGLARGRQLTGKIAFLGGPIHFFDCLKKQFKETLALSDENAVFPEYDLFFVAAGAAIYAKESGTALTYNSLAERLKNAAADTGHNTYMRPLFETEEEYQAFSARHQKAAVEFADLSEYKGDAYLGIDCGSTTVKLVLTDSDNRILYSYYSSNKGNPLEAVKKCLLEIYSLCEDRVTIRGSAATGYGESLMVNAFGVDFGLVETMAHFKATSFFRPDVDFIIDIGGQDIKCFKIKNGAIDNIMLNEACSSGCGSFIETFAKSMGYDAEEFAKLGIFAKHPVDLGSRCTVFMNSSVKQSQKDGASIHDISAGLSVSVVKNALYKVIRAKSADDLGNQIVVQGGTFYNDAVLRSFEREIGKEVTRPTIAGLMGAFGAALYAKEQGEAQSSISPKEELENFVNTTKEAVCGGCTNKCRLTVNTFSGGRKFISGNRCETPLKTAAQKDLPNAYQYKRSLFDEEKAKIKPGTRGKIGMPYALNIIELYPFWTAFFAELGIEVVFSEPTTRKTYELGRDTIPSDTVCYPAKLVHGAISDLIHRGIDTIFYPCMSYNLDEEKGDNHFNCPVVAYYPELIAANMPAVKTVRFLYPYLGIDHPDTFPKQMMKCLAEVYPDIKRAEVKRAAKKAYAAIGAYREKVREFGRRGIAYAEEHDLPIIVLAGRPYHIDPEINHGIDRLVSSLGVVVLSDDSVCDFVSTPKVSVLNQWTYHSRLYSAAKFCARSERANFVQLVSFGCGIDAVTTDECRSILEREDKLYTQIKIDEINNSGAVKIRLRSLLCAIEQKTEVKPK
ncbi:MAG TPA: 2-hydroxyglutaryl-CoA dehydratase [Clostridiales bacterium]|mgnify:FL=1|nr:2-hydroxyglutaryl-CoA dehydratase [Clostridiales bacterium]HBL83033.1 2-hydroxyglutaryl-CoA dehydratase [Clostridiales bacterium]